MARCRLRDTAMGHVSHRALERHVAATLSLKPGDAVRCVLCGTRYTAASPRHYTCGVCYEAAKATQQQPVRALLELVAERVGVRA